MIAVISLERTADTDRDCRHSNGFDRPVTDDATAADRRSVPIDLEVLVRLFYADPRQLGQFEEVSADDLPAVYRTLLAHDGHMTVTVEGHHADRVDVEVLDRVVTATHYARKILLRRRRDGRAVQFGIMRVAFAQLAPEVRAEIESQRTPLGRVLIERNVLRSVQWAALWRVTPWTDLSRLLGIAPREVIYGRTAIIYCDEEPAVELLEIVTREPTRPDEPN